MCKRALALFAVLACLAPVGVASAAVQGTTLLLSRSDGLSPLPAAGDNGAQTTQRALSGDGRFVVFQSGADDLGARDGVQHVWLRDTRRTRQRSSIAARRQARERELGRRQHQPRRVGGLLHPRRTTSWRGSARQRRRASSRAGSYVVRFAAARSPSPIARAAPRARSGRRRRRLPDRFRRLAGRLRLGLQEPRRRRHQRQRRRLRARPHRSDDDACERHGSGRGSPGGGRRRARGALRRRQPDRLGYPRVAARGRHQRQRIRHLRPRHVRGHDVPRQPGDRQRRRRW